MNSQTDSTRTPARATDEQRLKAFMELESPMMDLKTMAEVVGYLVCDNMSNLEEGKPGSRYLRVSEHVVSLITFTVYEVEARANRLADQFQAAFVAGGGANG